MTTDTFTWKRQPSGQYVARHGFWVYTVFRTDMAPSGRQWILEAYPEANPNAVQQRKDFASARVAKISAEHTHCFRCGRSVPFGATEPMHHEKGRNWMVHTWRCRDRETCEAEYERITARGFAKEYARLLTDIRETKTKVCELETRALAMRGRAMENGTTDDELRAIEATAAAPTKFVDQPSDLIWKGGEQDASA